MYLYRLLRDMRVVLQRDGDLDPAVGVIFFSAGEVPLDHFSVRHVLVSFHPRKKLLQGGRNRLVGASVERDGQHASRHDLSVGLFRRDADRRTGRTCLQVVDAQKSDCRRPPKILVCLGRAISRRAQPFSGQRGGTYAHRGDMRVPHRPRHFRAVLFLQCHLHRLIFRAIDRVVLRRTFPLCCLQSFRISAMSPSEICLAKLLGSRFGGGSEGAGSPSSSPVCRDQNVLLREAGIRQKSAQFENCPMSRDGCFRRLHGCSLLAHSSVQDRRRKFVVYSVSLLRPWRAARGGRQSRRSQQERLFLFQGIQTSDIAAAQGVANFIGFNPNERNDRPNSSIFSLCVPDFRRYRTAHIV